MRRGPMSVKLKRVMKARKGGKCTGEFDRRLFFLTSRLYVYESSEYN